MGNPRDSKKDEKTAAVDAKTSTPTVFKKSFTASEVLALFPKNKVFTKVVAAPLGNDTSLNFVLDQFADPEHIRPIKDLDAKAAANRNKVCDLTTLTWVERRANEDRGEAKPGTRFVKKTSVSKPPIDGKMTPFVEDLYVGFIFEHDDYKSPDQNTDQLVKLPRHPKTGIPKYSFEANAVTNERFWLEYQQGPKRLTQSVSLQLLEQKNQIYRDMKQIPPHNEIMACPSKESIRGIFVNKLLHGNAQLVAPKLNALRVKYMVLDRLGIDVPTVIMTPETGIVDYPLKDQVTEVIAGLESDSKTSPYRHQFAHLVFDRCFLANDALWKALSAPASFHLYQKGLPTKLALYSAMLLSIHQNRHAPLIQEWTELIKNDKPASKASFKLFFELIAKNNIEPIILVNFFADEVPLHLMLELIQEKHAYAVGHALDFIFNRFPRDHEDIKTLAHQLILSQQYELAEKVLITIVTNRNQDIVLEDIATGNNGLHELYRGEHKNIRPSNELIALLAQSNPVRQLNKAQKTVLTLAIERKAYENVDYFLAIHFCDFSVAHLLEAFALLLLAKHFQLLKHGLEKADAAKHKPSKILVPDSKHKLLMPTNAKELAHYKEFAQQFHARFKQEAGSMLHHAIAQTHPKKKADIETIESIYNCFDVSEARNAVGETPLMHAIRIDRVDIVRYFTQNPSRISKEAFAEAMPKMIAKQYHFIEALVNARPGISQTRVSKEGSFPLHCLIEAKELNVPLIKAWCDKSIRVISNDPIQTRALLFLAYKRAAWEVLNYFIERYRSQFKQDDIRDLFFKLLALQPNREATQTIHLILTTWPANVPFVRPKGAPYPLDVFVEDEKPDLEAIKKIIQINKDSLRELQDETGQFIKTILQKSRWDILDYVLRLVSRDIPKLFIVVLSLLIKKCFNAKEAEILRPRIMYLISKSHFPCLDLNPFATCLSDAVALNDLNLVKKLMTLTSITSFDNFQSIDTAMMYLADDAKVTTPERLEQLQHVYQLHHSYSEQALVELNLRFLRKIVERLESPIDLLELMNAVINEERLRPRMTNRFGLGPSLNVWNGAAASTLWTELVHFVKDKILQHAKQYFATYDKELTAAIELFLGKQTRKGFFTSGAPEQLTAFQKLSVAAPTATAAKMP